MSCSCCKLGDSIVTALECSLGATLDIARNGSDAMKLAAEKHYALVCKALGRKCTPTDVSLPNIGSATVRVKDQLGLAKERLPG